MTIRSDIHATEETNWRRPPRNGLQVTPMTDEDIARLTRPDHEMDSIIRQAEAPSRLIDQVVLTHTPTQGVNQC